MNHLLSSSGRRICLLLLIFLASVAGCGVEPAVAVDAAPAADASEGARDASPVPPRVELASSDAVLRLDRLTYLAGHEARVRLTLAGYASDRQRIPVFLVEPRRGDVEYVVLERVGADAFETSSGVRLTADGGPRPGDGALRVEAGDVVHAAFYPDPRHEPALRATTQVLFDAALIVASEAASEVAPARIVPELAGSEDPASGAPGERPHATIVTPGERPLVVASDELVLEEMREGDLSRFLQDTGGRVIATDAAAGESTQYLVRVDLSRAPTSAFSRLQAMSGVTEQVIVSAPEALSLLAFTWWARLEGYAVGLNPRMEFANRPTPREHTASCEASGFRASISGPDFDVPTAWLTASMLEADRASISVAFLDQGFDPNPDFVRAGETLRECTVEGAETWDLSPAGIRCGPGLAAGPPVIGASFFGSRVWHGNLVVSHAGAVMNNGFGTAGVAGQVMRPMLYKLGSAAYAFELGMAIRRAAADGASVINVSAGFPCRILTTLGSSFGICSAGGRAGFCAAATAALTLTTSAVCATVPVLAAIPFVGVILGPAAALACGAAAAATVAASAACFSTLAAGRFRTSIERGVTAATRLGVPVVASAGNVLSRESLPPVIRDIVNVGERRSDRWQFVPCVIEGVICVGAAAAEGAHENLEFYGSAVDLWAPDSSAYAAPPTSTRRAPAVEHVMVCPSGATSGAAAYVSGLIALVQAVAPALDPRASAEVRADASSLSRLPGRVRELLQGSAHAAVGDRGLLVHPRRAIEAAARLRGAPDFAALGYVWPPAEESAS
jgi:subtilisin family serine protease